MVRSLSAITTTTATARRATMIEKATGALCAWMRVKEKKTSTKGKRTK
jgi:hypothetical protein